MNSNLLKYNITFIFIIIIYLAVNKVGVLGFWGAIR
jgi:hypothetical protein